MICVWVWAMSSEWRSEDNFWDCVLSLSLYYKLNSGCQAVREELCPLRHLTVLKQYLLKWKYHSLCEQKLPVKRQKNSSHWLYVPRKRNSVLGAQWGEQVWEAPGGTRYSPLSSMLLVVGVSVLGSALTWTRDIYMRIHLHTCPCWQPSVKADRCAVLSFLWHPLWNAHQHLLPRLRLASSILAQALLLHYLSGYLFHPDSSLYSLGAN